MAFRTLSRSFGGGEITPEYFGRVDDPTFAVGLAKCRNMLILPHGPAALRPGTQFVREVKDSTKSTRLIRFNYGIIGGVPQSFALEMGEQYFRFHTNAATLLAGTPAAYNGATAYTIGDLVLYSGRNYYCIAASTGNLPTNVTYWYAMPLDGVYEIPSPYAEDDLFDIHYVQSADVLTLVHPNYTPRELRRYGADDWVLTTIGFTSSLTAPGSPVATATVGIGTTTYNYKITAIGETGLEEGLPSAAATVTNDLLTTGNYNTITWAAVSGASRYNVYKQSNGLYGYMGQTDVLTFKDDNINPDISRTPPIANDPFTGAGNYPDAVSYAEQRRIFAGTDNKPQNLWMTRSGTESNLAYSIPTRDDDSITFRVAAREASRILHVVPLTSILLLTSSAEWAVTSQNTDVLTPTSVSVKPQSYIGSSNVQPVVINNNMIFAAARGGHLRECAYNWQASGFITGDLSLRAPHLFDNKTLLDMSYAKSPQPIVWVVSSDGTLIGLTYVPEQKVGALHWHDSYTSAGTIQSIFESTVVVEEGEGDFQYLIVKRTIDGQDVRYVERMNSRLFATPADAFFVDCGLTYHGAATTTITNLDHLEGETVSILADGAVHAQRVVAGGIVTLDAPAEKVHVGLRIVGDLQIPPLVFQMEALGQGRQKNVNRVWVRVAQSSGIFAGPSFDDLQEAKVRTDEPYGSPPALKDGEIEIMLPPSWSDGGQICIRQIDPLPLTLCSMTLEVAIGG